MSRIILALVASLLAATAVAAEPLVEGVDYYLIPDALVPEVPAKEVTVEEFFNFSCPACNAMQTLLELWLEAQPDYVHYTRVPVPFERWGGLYAKTFYVLEAFGREDLQKQLFSAIHSERKLLNSAGRMVQWMGEHGFDVERAEKAFSSFAVDTKVRRARRKMEGYGVDSTPQIVIAGRYRMTASLLGSYERLFATMDRIIKAIKQGEPPI